MDVNATLQRIREINQEVEIVSKGDLPLRTLGLLEELSELTSSLDEWFSGGGFLPAAWNVGGQR